MTRPYQPFWSTVRMVGGVVFGTIGFLAFMAAICAPILIAQALREPVGIVIAMGDE